MDSIQELIAAIKQYIKPLSGVYGEEECREIAVAEASAVALPALESLGAPIAEGYWCGSPHIASVEGCKSLVNTQKLCSECSLCKPVIIIERKP